jgi:hypothetical protein
MNALSQAAESVVDIREYCGVSLLDDEAIEKAEAARERVEVNVITRFIRNV